jgi:YbbR domain-containing protein
MASVRQQTNRPTSSGVASRAVLAAVLAFGFWAWVTNNNNPDRQRDFDGVPVTVLNRPDGLADPDISPTIVTVSIWGPQSVVSNPALQAGNLAATIDLKEVKPGTQQVPVRVQSTLNGLRKKSAEPTSVQVRIERSIERTMPVTIPTPTQPGVKVNSVTATPSEVRVSGPESKVNAVTEIVATPTIADHTASFTSQVEVKALDASNREVGGVTLSPQRVSVAIDLLNLRNEQVVPVSTADPTGAPAPGFKLDTITVTPQQITLTGDPQAIRAVPNIPTQPFSIAALSQSMTLDVPLDTSRLPPGVAIKGNLTSVRVQVNIVEITQDRAFSQIPIQPVNLRTGLTPTLAQQFVTITLRGTRQQLDQINSTNIIALVNLAGFTGPGGARDLPIEVQVPPGNSVSVVKVDPPSIPVSVAALPTPTPVPATATPRPTATPVPTATPALTATPTATP